MRTKDIITSINGFVDSLNFSTARKFIEENYELVSENRHLLNHNAREIFKFVEKHLNSEEEPLTRDEIRAITVVNTYATKFDLRGLKLTLKGKEQLFLKEHVLGYLNADAKILLEGLGVINKRESCTSSKS